MKRYTKEEIAAIYDDICRLIDDKTINRAGPMLELFRIRRWIERDGIEKVDMDRINKEIIEIPLSEVMAYRRYGLDIRKHNFDENLED